MMPYDALKAANVIGTEHVLGLAMEAKESHGRKIAFYHISTIGIALHLVIYFCWTHNLSKRCIFLIFRYPRWNRTHGRDDGCASGSTELLQRLHAEQVGGRAVSH
jgi:hypothetical protein